MFLLLRFRSMALISRTAGLGEEMWLFWQDLSRYPKASGGFPSQKRLDDEMVLFALGK